MRIFSRGTLGKYWTLYPPSEQQLKAWFRVVKNARWKNHNELKQQIGNSSIIDDKRVVFNIKGNDFRLIVDIEYKFGFVFIVWFGNHKEYDKLDVKNLSYDETD